MRLLTVLLACLFSRAVLAADLLLIIDDMGNSQRLGEQALVLPAPINFAFLPHTPAAEMLANTAHKLGHGILLHLPMASSRHRTLGPGGLYPEMSKAELQQSLLQSLSAIPHLQGVNNHMGSLLTSQPKQMQWVMEVLRHQGLFFVDSLTSSSSVALAQAKVAGVPSLKRDVFLDNDLDFVALERQFQQALSIARKRGYAVLIGHPYPNTLAYLKTKLPTLPDQGIKLVRVEDFFRTKLWQTFPPTPHLTRYQLE